MLGEDPEELIGILPCALWSQKSFPPFTKMHLQSRPEVVSSCKDVNCKKQNSLSIWTLDGTLVNTCPRVNTEVVHHDGFHTG